jgi:hypothetical protein
MSSKLLYGKYRYEYVGVISASIGSLLLILLIIIKNIFNANFQLFLILD